MITISSVTRLGAVFAAGLRVIARDAVLALRISD